MDTTRRCILGSGLAGLALLAGSRVVRAESRAGSLRFLRLRHASFLVELEGVRVLIDPTFLPDLGFGPFLNAPPPARNPASLGEIDLLLVTSGRPDHFSPKKLGPVAARRPYALVPDERVAKKLRHLGMRRVRVVQPGDRFTILGVEVEVTPAQDLLTNAPAFGYRLRRAGRSLWHTGPLPPLDLFGDAAEYARTHPAEVVLASADGTQVGASFRVSMDGADARLLGQVAGARYVVPQQDGFEPAGLGHLLLRKARAAPAPVTARLTPVDDGRWVRVSRPREG